MHSLTFRVRVKLP